MNPKEIVAEYYDKVLSRLGNDTSNLDETDCMVYLIVSVLRTIHADDFEAIFEVLLNEEDLMNFIDFLEVLDESDLADDFRQAQCILEEAGYELSCEGEPVPEELSDTLETIKSSIVKSPGLERLQVKLAETIQGY